MFFDIGATLEDQAAQTVIELTQRHGSQIGQAALQRAASFTDVIQQSTGIRRPSLARKGSQEIASTTNSSTAAI